MKKVLALLLSLAMVIALGGCSLFTSGDESGSSAAGGSELKVTDDYTHKDPEGLEYATRYVFYSGEECALVEMLNTYYDVTPTLEFIVIYADKDDVALAQYTYIVMESEEDAQKFAKAAAEMGSKVEVSGSVTIQEMNQEEMANTIDTFIAMNVLTDTSAAKYAAMQKEMDMLIDYNPQ